MNALFFKILQKPLHGLVVITELQIPNEGKLLSSGNYGINYAEEQGPLKIFFNRMIKVFAAYSGRICYQDNLQGPKPRAIYIKIVHSI